MKSKHNKNLIPNSNLKKNYSEEKLNSSEITFIKNNKNTLFSNNNTLSFSSWNKNTQIKIMHILFLFCFISILSLSQCKSKKHFCGTDLLKTPKRILIPEEPLSSSLTPKRLNIHGQKWEPLRIHFDFSYISQKVSEGIIKHKDLLDLQEKVMPKAQEVFQRILSVKRIKSKLKLNSPHCETFPIPDLYNHASEGVSADIVIFVLIDTSGFFSENGIEAAAIHCLQHQETRRPIAGYIQFKSDLNVNSQFSKDYYAWLAIHEISHILVINRALYEDYIDPDTLAPLGYDSVIGSKVLESGSKMNFIKTPKVMEIAKQHFGCDKLFGLPLEYNGGPGTAGSHWAKRYMNGDYMIGESFGENLISEISLALFEDSGWYKVNREMANLFLWGKGKGCEFFDRSKKCVYAEKVEIDIRRLNSTLFEFALNEKGKNYSEISKGNESEADNNKIFISKDDLVVKDNIFKNKITKERVSLKVQRKKATERVKELDNQSKLKKNKIKTDLSKNSTNNNTINTDNSYSNNIYDKNSFLKIFENHILNKNFTNGKKFILEYKTDFKDEFCIEFNMPICSTSHLFRGSCTVEDPSDPIEKHEMLFKNTRISGFEKLTDRCPTAIESRYKQASYGGSCRYGESFPSTKSFEKICPECACFISNLSEIPSKNQIKKNFRVNSNHENNKINDNETKNKIINQITLVTDNILKNENFLKESKDNTQYEKITIFSQKTNDQIHFSFIEEKLKNKNTLAYEENKNKESNEVFDDNYDEEYEIIKLNPALKPNDFQASCFEFKCDRGELYVILNESKFKCEEEGKVTRIPGYEGGIKCPNKSILCDEKYLCKFGCVEKFNNTIDNEKFEEEK